MRVALFDYRVVPTNPIGYCHLHMLEALCLEHDFTVFSVEFENPHPDRIRWVRIPLPTRPLAMMFLGFHLLAPYCYALHCRASSTAFDFIQFGECSLAFGDLAYVHFCHRFYLRDHWHHSHASGTRGYLSRLHHWLLAQAEPWVYRRVHDIVVPSQGLAREIETEYPYTKSKIHVLPNPVDTEQMLQPYGFDREGMRHQLGISETNLAFVFIALGHFERKGLPMLLKVLSEMADPRVKLVVVGGERDLVSVYRERVRRMGLESRVSFVGLQRSIGPYLWAADAFIMPSYYEAFPLVASEAAAAGIPLMTTPVSGVVEFINDGENGILFEPNPLGLAQGIRRFLELSPKLRKQMGNKARQAISRFSLQSFSLRWQELFSSKSKTRC